MRVRNLSRRLGSVALVATLGLSMVACSSSDDSDADSKTDSSSTTGGEETGSDDSGDGGLHELAADEFYSEVMTALQEEGTFKMVSTTTSDESTVTMTGHARYTDDGMDMVATTEGDQALEMVMLDKVIYLKSADLGLADKWVKIDLNAGEDSLFGLLAKTMDPDLQFKLMQEPKSLELVGEEEVDGVATNHYKITVDPEKFMEAMDFPEGMAQFIPEELVSEMWVDENNLPRKVAQVTETGGKQGVPASTSTMEGTYSDFGAEVKIEAPPASEVTDQIPGM